MSTSVPRRSVQLAIFAAAFIAAVPAAATLAHANDSRVRLGGSVRVTTPRVSVSASGRGTFVGGSRGGFVPGSRFGYRGPIYRGPVYRGYGRPFIRRPYVYYRSPFFYSYY